MLILCAMYGSAHGLNLNTSAAITTRVPKPRQGASCSNMCGSGGICVVKAGHSPGAVCECFAGFYGLDCSLRLCPSANAWVDYPSASNVAHGEFSECSNQGLCDRNTGSCQCRSGFGGPACELMMCPTSLSEHYMDSNINEPCSGNGRCITLRQAADKQDYVNFFDNTAYAEWDADMLQGCACDEGWEGPACDRKSCPKGDDPETTGVNELQVFECTCTTCAGGITMSFKGETTLQIPYDASEELIKFRLNQLTTIDSIDLRITFGNTMCSSGGSLTAITFMLPHGSQPAITITPYSTLAGTINLLSKGGYSILDPHQEATSGTKEWTECSNRGSCDYDVGACRCIPGWESSDGNGAIGNRGDCGYRSISDLTVYTRPAVFNTSVDGLPLYLKDDEIVTSTVTNCPFTQNVGICSNNGVCETVTNQCICDSGYSGVLCDKKTCGSTNLWVNEVGAAHVTTGECGGVGTCNTDTGLCENCGGKWNVFSGDSCEYLSCPTNGHSECSGKGYCKSLRNLAPRTYKQDKELSAYTYTTPWDADSIYGCDCMRAPSIDNQYQITEYTPDFEIDTFNSSSFFLRGPYAFAATDYWGYECGLAKCPNGDDPSTRNDVNEVQKIRCTATAGTFTLTFRDNTTVPLWFNHTMAQMEYKLEQLYTIHRVNVEYLQSDGIAAAASDTFCSSDGSIYAHIEFMTEYGDLPLLQWTNVDLVDGSGAPAFVLSEDTKGTKEDVECSGQGVCNEYTGVCACRDGYGSSDGTSVGVGNRGDCTYRSKF